MTTKECLDLEVKNENQSYSVFLKLLYIYQNKFIYLIFTTLIQSFMNELNSQFFALERRLNE